MKSKRHFQRPQHASRRQKKGPAPGGSAIYGWHSALAALQNPQRTIRRILATENALARLASEKLPPSVADDLPTPISAGEIEHIVGAQAVHQGLAVICEPLPEKDIEDIADARLILVLDQVTDPHNVGAILRTAAAFGVGALVMTERHGAAETGVLAKAASGGLEHVPLVRVTNLARALREIADHGYTICGLDSEHAEPIESLPPAEKCALVLGAEGRGLRRLTREACDHLVRLDMPGAIKSLNVSNAAAVALYALAHKNDM
jgi:23S rRNA (guanosine2251-2'-O)-methyltransferase